MKKIISTEELKSIELDLVKYFHNLCVQNGLRYYIIGGTLLGAVRHKGFIPWDDDVDVEMPREDYERLIDMFDDINIRSDIDLMCFERNDQFYVPFGKLINKKTHFQEEVENGIEIGVGIDIFPIDNLSDDYAESKRIYKSIERLRTILDIKNMVNSRERSLIKQAIICFGKLLFAPISRKKITGMIIQKSRKNNNHTTNFVGVVSSGLYGADKEILMADWFEKMVSLPFEDTFLFASNGYKEILCKLYGDYNQLPPIEKRVAHHSFEAWICEDCES
ncbi:LicD family protein [Coprococcus catus]